MLTASVRTCCLGMDVSFDQASAAVSAADKTTWDGVYTQAQAARGKVAYDAACSSCHMSDLSGGGEFDMQVAPALVRADFMEGRTMNSVYTFVRSNMPADAAGALPPQTYLDILAYVLQQNEFPAGKDELVPDAATLANIRITNTKPD